MQTEKIFEEVLLGSFPEMKQMVKIRIDNEKRVLKIDFMDAKMCFENPRAIVHPTEKTIGEANRARLHVALDRAIDTMLRLEKAAS